MLIGSNKDYKYFPWKSVLSRCCLNQSTVLCMPCYSSSFIYLTDCLQEPHSSAALESIGLRNCSAGEQLQGAVIKDVHHAVMTTPIVPSQNVSYVSLHLPIWSIYHQSQSNDLCLVPDHLRPLGGLCSLSLSPSMSAGYAVTCRLACQRPMSSNCCHLAC